MTAATAHHDLHLRRTQQTEKIVVQTAASGDTLANVTFTYDAQVECRRSRPTEAKYELDNTKPTRPFSLFA